MLNCKVKLSHVSPGKFYLAFYLHFHFLTFLKPKLPKFRKHTGHTTTNAPKEVILSLISIISLSTTLDAVLSLTRTKTKSLGKKTILELILFDEENILTLKMFSRKLENLW